jgi:GNAT superfamily N-acetyltransferase
LIPLIRRALPEDAHDLLSLIQNHAAFEGGMVSLAVETLKELLEQSEPLSLIWLAENVGPVGYAALTFDYALWSGERFGHLDCMFVNPAHRGCGIGRALFGAIVVAARLAGATRLEWQTPLWNEDGRLFYARMGATSSPKHRFCLAL